MTDMNKYIKNCDLRAKIKEQKEKIKDYKIKINFLNSLIIIREKKIEELEEKISIIERHCKEKDIIMGNLLYELDKLREGKKNERQGKRN